MKILFASFGISQLNQGMIIRNGINASLVFMKPPPDIPSGAFRYMKKKAKHRTKKKSFL